jgi:hypothetical protein
VEVGLGLIGVEVGVGVGVDVDTGAVEVGRRSLPLRMDLDGFGVKSCLDFLTWGIKSEIFLSLTSAPPVLSLLLLLVAAGTLPPSLLAEAASTSFSNSDLGGLRSTFSYARPAVEVGLGDLGGMVRWWWWCWVMWVGQG